MTLLRISSLLLIVIILCTVISDLQPIKGYTSNSELIITELMPNPVGADEVGEWLEIENFSNSEVNLQDWLLEDLSLPEVRIAAQEIIILARDISVIKSLNPGINNQIVLTNFVFINSGTTIKLTRKDHLQQSIFTYSEAQAGKSFELMRGNCEKIEMNLQGDTIGKANTQCPENLTPTAPITATDITAAPQIVIFRVNPNPSSDSEWLELKNFSTSAVDLNNWYIKDSSENGSKYTIKNQVLSGNSYLQIFPQGISLNNEGDTLYLFNANSEAIDIFHYEKTDKGTILGAASVVTPVPSISLTSKEINLVQTTVTTYSHLAIPKIYRLKLQE